MQPYANGSRTDRVSAGTLIDILADERVVAMVRAGSVADPEGLCGALTDGGISAIELTFTIADLPHVLERAAKDSGRTGAFVGAGTVLTAEDARSAVDAGARFLVTPGQSQESAEIVQIGHAADAAVVLGALTPSEVLEATNLGADMIKIFPARAMGPQFLTDLRGPYPDARLLPSGGISVDNAQDFLSAGAAAVCAGTSVVTAAAVESSDWPAVTANARAMCAALSGERRTRDLDRPGLDGPRTP